MTRAQVIVHRGNRLLLVQHRRGKRTWWCLPGGGVEAGETPAEAALRELEEECNVSGVIIRQTSHLTYAMKDDTYTYLVEIGEQTPLLGHDPEAESTSALCGMQWRTLAELTEKDRAFIWAAGLIGVEGFLDEVMSWGESISYPPSSE